MEATKSELRKHKLRFVVLPLIVILSAALVFLCVAFANYLYRSNTYEALPVVVARDKGEGSSAKTLVCVYNVGGALPTHGILNDFPVRYCTYVVVCCLRQLRKNSDFDKQVWNAVRMTQRSVPSERLVLGLSATRGRGLMVQSRVRSAIMRSSYATTLVDAAVAALDEHDIGGGAFLYMPNFDANITPQNFRFFVKRFAYKLREERRRIFFVSLPVSEKEQNMYLTRHLLRYGVYFVKATHFLPPDRQASAAVICSTRLKLGQSPFSVEGAAKSILDVHFGWPLHKDGYPGPYASGLRHSTLFTFDLACFKYTRVVVDKDSKFDLRDRKLVGYEAFCKANANRSTAWTLREDEETKCKVLLSSSAALTVSNPKVVDHLKKRFSNKFAGVVLYNIQLDDVHGACGQPFSFTKQVYCRLQGLNDTDCRGQ